MAALLRTSPNLGLRIRNLALTRTNPSTYINTRFASSLDTPIRTTPPASRTARRTTSSPPPRKEFVSAFVGGTSIDDTTPTHTPLPALKSSSYSRRSSPTRAVATASSASTPNGLSSKHLLVNKDFAKFVQKQRTPQQVLDHVMEARYHRDRDFMLGRILNEYLKQDQVYNIEPLIIEVMTFELLIDRLRYVERLYNWEASQSEQWTENFLFWITRWRNADCQYSRIRILSSSEDSQHSLSHHPTPPPHNLSTAASNHSTTTHPPLNRQTL